MQLRHRLVVGALSSLALAALLCAELAAQGPAAPPPARSLGWGANGAGQTGVTGAPTPVLLPATVALPAGRRATALAAGSEFSLAALDDGTLAVWGRNDAGQLGLGTADDLAHAPTIVPGMAGVIAVAAGGSHGLAIRDESGVRSVWAWGDGSLGQLGTGASGAAYRETSPIEVTGLTGVRAIAAGAFHSLAVLDDGSVWAWGDGSVGQLGNGASGLGYTAPAPQRVVLADGNPLADVAAVAAGHFHSLALRSDGSVFTWGSNDAGQLAQTSLAVFSVAMAISEDAPLPAGFSGVVALAGGARHSLALTSSGSVWVWGGNESGQIGNGTASSEAFTTPQLQSNLAGVESIAAGDGYSLAVRNDGSVWAWGRNASGQLGTGDTSARSVPSRVRNAQFVSIAAAGRDHSLAQTYRPAVTVDVSAPASIACRVRDTATFTLEGYDLVYSGVSEIVLVLDESSSVAPDDFLRVKAFARDFVNVQNIGATTVRVGLVLFDSTARQITGLSSSKQTVLTAIDGVVPRQGGTCIGCGIQLADTLLAQLSRGGVPRTIVVVSHGRNALNLAQFPAILATAKGRNTLVSIGVGGAVDADEVRNIASHANLAFLAADAGALVGLAGEVAAVVPSPGVSMARLTVAFTPGIAPLSASNAGVVTGQQVSWLLATLGSTPVPLRVTFEHRGAGGTIPLLTSAVYSDNQRNTPAIAPPSVAVKGCPATMALSPATAVSFVDELHTVTATVRDDFSAPVPGAGVRFTVTAGPNAGRGSAAPIVSDAHGEARFTYANTGGPGTDTIAASIDGFPGVVTSPVEKVWRLRNEAPLADASAPATVVLSGSPFASVTLDGSASLDPDAGPNPLTYQWSEVGVGPVGTGAVVTVAGVALGVHVFRLTVSDGDLSGDDDVVVQVVDATPPLVAPSVSGPLGDNSWYVGDVAVTFAVTDAESAFTASGCDPTVVNVDTPGVNYTCSAASAGGTSAATVFVKRDATPPVVTPPLEQFAPQTSPAGAVVEYPAPDVLESGSGIDLVRCAPASGSVFPVGVTTVTCTAADRAGLSGTASFTVTVVSSPDGQIHGSGHLDDAAGGRHQFSFRVSQVALVEAGKLKYRAGRGKSKMEFEATTITAVVFRAANSVVIAGIGTWDDEPGYTFEAAAIDQGKGGPDDVFSIAVRRADGTVVASVAGTLAGGQVKVKKLKSD